MVPVANQIERGGAVIIAGDGLAVDRPERRAEAQGGPDAVARRLVLEAEALHVDPVGLRQRSSPPRLLACFRKHMTELDHLPRHEIGYVDPDVSLRQI